MASPEIAGMVALAQQLAMRELGRRLSFDEIRSLLKSTGATIVDGDDENDVVLNTGLTFKRVDMLAMAEAILAMRPPVSHAVTVTAGAVADGKDFGFASSSVVQGLASDDFIVGAALGEIIRGGAGADRIDAGDGDDELHGEGGDDYLIPGADDDTVDGGEGNDTVAFLGVRSSYAVSYDSASSTYTITSASEGTDRITRVEWFEFANLTVAAANLVDNTAPLAQSFAPADGATSVSVTTSIVVTFSEAIELGTGAIVLKKTGGATVETFDAANSSRISIAGNALTIDPTNDLLPGTSYLVEFASGAVRDLAGNPYGGTTTYDFATAAPANTAPVANNSSANGTEDSSITGTATATDADGNSLTFSVVTQPAKGSVTMNANGSYTYTPHANTHGTDSFSFRASDGQAFSNTATVAITITPVNDAPTGALTVSGTARIFERLSAQSTVADVDGLGVFSYQWLRNGAPITGATASTYDLPASDAGALISVRASYTDGDGTPETVTSAATAAVQGYNPVTGTSGNDNLTGTTAPDSITGLAGNDTLAGGAGNDVVDGGAGSDLLIGGAGNNTLVGGSTVNALGGPWDHDVVSYAASTSAVQVNLATGVATHGGGTDALIAIEAVIGSAFADTITGLNGVPVGIGETFRPGAGNDTVHGGAGMDMVQYSGARSAYDVAYDPVTGNMTVTHRNAGADGVDTLTGVERLRFTDTLQAYGDRAIELAKVAFALWTPGIHGHGNLFARGISYLDNGSFYKAAGYTYDDLINVALIFFPQLNNAQLADHLVASIPGSGYTSAQLLAVINQNGGGDAGRAAATKLVADSPATMAQIDLVGYKTVGVSCDLIVEVEGQLLNLFPALPG